MIVNENSDDNLVSIFMHSCHRVIMIEISMGEDEYIDQYESDKVAFSLDQVQKSAKGRMCARGLHSTSLYTEASDKV